MADPTLPEAIVAVGGLFSAGGTFLGSLALLLKHKRNTSNGGGNPEIESFDVRKKCSAKFSEIFSKIGKMDKKLGTLDERSQKTHNDVEYVRERLDAYLDSRARKINGG